MNCKEVSWRGTPVFDNAVVSYNGGAVIHFTHPTWRQDRNDPATATRVNGMKVRLPFTRAADLPESLKPFVATGEEASIQPAERNIYDTPLAIRRQVRKLALS